MTDILERLKQDTPDITTVLRDMPYAAYGKRGASRIYHLTNQAANYIEGLRKEVDRLKGCWQKEAEDCEQQRARADDLDDDRCFYVDKLIKAGINIGTLRLEISALGGKRGCWASGFNYNHDCADCNPTAEQAQEK